MQSQHLGKQRQEDYCKLEASLFYTVRNWARKKKDNALWSLF